MHSMNFISRATYSRIPPPLSTIPTDVLIKKGLFSMCTGVMTVAIYHQVENFLNQPSEDFLARHMTPDKFNQYLALRQNNQALVTDAAALSLALFFSSVSEGNIINMMRNADYLCHRACCCLARVCRYLVQGGD